MDRPSPGTQLLGRYRIEEEISRGSGSTMVYRCRDEGAARSVVIKCTQADAADVTSEQRLRREHRLLERLRERGAKSVVRPMALEQVDGRVLLVLEDIGGVDLERLAGGVPMPVAQVLKLAAGLLAGIAEVHDAGLLHLDVNPRNVVCNPRNGALRLIDFDVAVPQHRDLEAARTARVGTVAYMAPEQTGRTDAGVDERTDFYGLGATLYALLLGSPPFAGTEAAELLHAIVAQPPPLLHTRRSDVPEGLAQVVHKLLRKSPTERYQSVHGIASDLLACDSGTTFEVGQHDRREHFVFSAHLYGRSGERQELIEAYQRSSTGKPELILLLGAPGVGKSRLMAELRPMLHHEGGLVAEGKCDLGRRDVPFSVLAACVDAAVRQILMRPRQQVAAWSQVVQAALGTSGACVVNVVPALELLVGPQRPLVQLAPQQEENRTLNAFARLFDALTAEVPWVLFIDDVQWADPGTYKVLQQILGPRLVSRKLLVVLACRDEAFEAAPIGLLVRGLANHLPVQTLPLRPLQVHAVQGLLADGMSMAADDERLVELARVLCDKTHGNPFFLRGLLAELTRSGRLVFDQALGTWRWDVQQLRGLAVAENVLEFTQQKIADLPEAPRALLGFVALLGGGFAVDTLEALLGPQHAGTLNLCVDAGMLLPAADGVSYKFAHDRIQEACLGLLSADAAMHAHKQIGLHGLAALDASAREPRQIFAAADHLMACVPILSPAQVGLLRALLVQAGEEARCALAYAPGMRYLQASLDLPGALSREETSATRAALANLVYLGGNPADALQRFDALLLEAEGPLQRAALQVHRCHILYSLYQPEAAFQAAQDGLAWLGIHVESKPSILRVIGAILQLRRGVAKMDFATFAARQELTDPRADLALRLMGPITTAAFSLGQDTFFLVGTAEIFDLILRHGNCDLSAAVLCAVGLVYSAAFEDRIMARRLVQLNKEIVRLRPSRWPSVRMGGEIGSSHDMSLEQQIQLGRHGHEQGMLEGEYFMAVNCAMWGLDATFQADLPQVAAAYEPLAAAAARGIRNRLSQRCALVIKQSARCLMGQTRSPVSMDDASFDQAQYERELEDAQSPMERAQFHAFLCQMALVADDVPRAEAHALALVRLDVLKVYKSVEIYALAFWTVAFIALARAAAARGALRVPHPVFIWRGMRLVRSVGRALPNSRYRGVAPLVRAEVAAVAGRLGEATALYEEAARLWEASGHRSMALLVHEGAARVYLKLGSQASVVHHLQRARDIAQAWGAMPKVKALEAQLERSTVTHMGAQTERSTKTAHNLQADWQAVARGSEQMAGERQTAGLMGKLLQLMLSTAGGTEATLVMMEAQVPMVYAQHRAAGAPSALHEPLDGCSQVPQRLVAYALQARESVLLRQGDGNALWADAYFKTHAPPTVLCLPLLRRDVAVGALYMENQHTADAFSLESRRLCEALATQAAIALENVELYTRLEQRVTERTEALHASQQRVVELEREMTERQMAGGFAHEVLNALTPASFGIASMGSDGPAHRALRELQTVWEAARVHLPLDAAAKLRPRLDEALEQLAHQQEVLNTVAPSVARVTRITTKILEYAEASNQVPGASLCPLRSSVDAALGELQQGIEVHNSVAPTVAVRMKAEHLSTILQALLANACDAAREAGKKRTPRVQVTTHQDAGGRIVVQVRDTGGGVSDAIQQRMYEPFVSSKGARGVGLALGITKKLVELYGGAIAYNHEAAGTTFEVTLPAAQALAD